VADLLRTHPQWLIPEWDAQGVGALMTTRHGGFSSAPFDLLNLRTGLGDDPRAVQRNQDLLAGAMDATPVYLNQVHGATVVRLRRADATPNAKTPTADASVTTEQGLACAIQVADCLPVLFAAPRGLAVGAAHAGWRGLALGVVETTLRAVCVAANCEPHEVRAWLGACIGAQAFEVGPDVLEAFAVPVHQAGSAHFVSKGAGKWWGDLVSLARDRLTDCGVRAISGGHWCTVSEPSRFFSYRRDRVTGRMVAAIWIERHPGF
jgi:YfiH family protein